MLQVSSIVYVKCVHAQTNDSRKFDTIHSQTHAHTQTHIHMYNILIEIQPKKYNKSKPIFCSFVLFENGFCWFQLPTSSSLPSSSSHHCTFWLNISSDHVCAALVFAALLLILVHAQQQQQQTQTSAYTRTGFMFPGDGKTWNVVAANDASLRFHLKQCSIAFVCVYVWKLSQCIIDGNMCWIHALVRPIYFTVHRSNANNHVKYITHRIRKRKFWRIFARIRWKNSIKRMGTISRRIGC